MAEQEQGQEIKYPTIQIAVGVNGIVFETFYSPTISMKMVLEENQVNEIFKAWVETRKQIQKEQQLAEKVKRKAH